MYEHLHIPSPLMARPPKASGSRTDIEPGTPREEQLQVIEKAAEKESWLTMLLRRRRESKGKPTRRSPFNRPWFSNRQRPND